MLKLYFGNSITIISTLLIIVQIGYGLWGYLSRTTIQKWGIAILVFILLHGVLWYLPISATNTRILFCMLRTGAQKWDYFP